MKNKILTSVLLSLIIIFNFTQTSSAASGSNYYSNLSNDKIEEIFSLSISDIPDAWEWISKTDTYVIIEERDGQYTYWWNAPNLQMSLFNDFYSNIALSGYGVQFGEELEGSENAETALEKYGFKIQSPVYMGERPMTTISILGVLKPDGIFDGVGRAWNFIWNKGSIIQYPSDKDLNSLAYKAPMDYESSGETFYNWVKENWYQAIKNIKPNQVLLESTDEDGMRDGKQWIAKNIIFDQGLDKPGLSADYICQELQEICGAYYGKVAEGILLSSGINRVHQYKRIMPYDLSRMNAIDAALFNGIADPRTEMQDNFLSTGYGNTIKNIMANWVIGASSFLAKMTVNINKITNFSFIESIDFDIMALWDNGIVQFLLFVMILILIFYSVKSAIQVATGKGSGFYILVKLICMFVLIGSVWGIGMEPERAYENTKKFSGIMSAMGNVLLDNTEGVKELYGTGDAIKREEVNLWLPYFNVWTVYHTNHSILDKEQLISESSGPELDGLKLPKIAGVKQDLWSTVLADATVTPERYSGNVYRMVDHFMAPRVKLIDAKSVNFKVSINENYNGHIQSSIHWGSLPMQLVLLLVVLIKALFFVELVFNLSFLVVNMSVSIVEPSKAILRIKELFASMANVAVSNIAITICVWTSMKAVGVYSLIISAVYILLIFSILKYLVVSNGPFSPKILKKPVNAIKRKINKLTAPSGVRIHGAPIDGFETGEQINQQENQQ